MKRVGLKQQFHGEPDPTQEGLAAELDGMDEITLDVNGGTISFLAPAEVPDNQVLQKNLIERFVNCKLKLENGAELTLWINAGACGVDVRMQAPKKGKPRGALPMVVSAR